MALVALSSIPISAFAQLTHDPLMNLMISQPQIDVDSPVTPVAGFDPPTVAPGASATYSVKLNALEASVEWPEKIATPDLSLRLGGHGQILALGNGKLQPHTTFNYHVRATRPGRYSVPEFMIRVYGKTVTIPAAQLTVVTNAADAPLPAPGLVLEVAETNLYVGQPVRVRLLLPAAPGGMVQALGQVQFNGSGFLADASTVRQQLGVIPGAVGKPMASYIYETTLTPIASGTLSAFAQGFTTGNRFTGGIVIANGLTRPSDFTLLDSEPVELRVHPLPHEGELPGFTGGFGPLSVELPTLSTNILRVGEPVKLTVRVRGDPGSSLPRLVPPPPPRVNDWQVFARTDNALPPLVQALGFTTFTYSLIPLTDKVQASPAIPFSCFDPEHGTYVDLTIPAVPVEVLPGSLPADFRIVEKANASDAAQEQEPALSGLAVTPGLASASLVPVQRRLWFPLAQLAPAAAFLGLFGWDRRRRYLEQHPGIVLRRRARRALRRHWRALRAAARNGNAAAFSAAAVDALQVACAPHYPARPRALVGSDVLALLPEDQAGGQAGTVVRRIFAVSDATRFGDAPADGAELLRMQPDLELVLSHLDERLVTPEQEKHEVVAK